MSQMDMQHCIDECLACYRTCTEMLQHCLQEGGRHALANHINAMADCAGMCSLSADFMIRSSELHHHTCGVCTEACERCAQSCENVNDSAEMQRCIDACHRCAENCRQMAHAHA